MVLSLPVLVPHFPNSLGFAAVSASQSQHGLELQLWAGVGQIIGEGLPNLMCSDRGLLQPHSSFGAPQQKVTVSSLTYQLDFALVSLASLLVPGNVETLNNPTVCFLVVGCCPACQGRLNDTTQLSTFSGSRLIRGSWCCCGHEVNGGGVKGPFRESRCFRVWVEIKKEIATQGSKIESHVECGEQGVVVQD